MQQIIERGQGGGPPMGGGMDGMGEGGTVVEMNIPGQKVGLIIGKGGETIRQLQVSFDICYAFVTSISFYCRNVEIACEWKHRFYNSQVPIAQSHSVRGGRFR